MDPSDEFVLIDDINGTVYTMEQNFMKGPKSVEIELYQIQYDKIVIQKSKKLKRAFTGLDKQKIAA